MRHHSKVSTEQFARTFAVHAVLGQLLPPSANYFRFNPPGVGDIPMDETDELQLTSLRNRTQLYLEQPDTRHDLDRCAALLAERYLEESSTPSM
eukprot:SAG11_NODE_4750_length_1781_cov_1.156361_1_plen_94_part_00